ncbi:MAG TPA: VWA domain-containing protein [Pyrinomonadaceae bacterium]|jgi:VWFA-related protein
MRKRSLLVPVLICALLAHGLAQTPAPQPSPATAPPEQQRQDQSDDDEVVRITTNLVQVDAVVTDKKGQPVTDLRPEDFEITEDGRPQKITNFSYAQLDPAVARSPAAAAPSAAANGAPLPPTRLRPEQVRRTIALVVDDLGLSFESTHFVRQALKKFVDQQMQPGDLVAIIRTAGGMGALQQFTSDRRQLYAAIERVRWYPLGRAGVGAFASIKNDPLSRVEDEMTAAGRTLPREDIDAFREDIFSVGTLGALNYIVKGLRELPGRKSILLLSDGLRIFQRDDPTRSTRILEALNRLTDLANRASVVIYTMDARGLQTSGLTAADDVGGMSANEVEQKLSDRRADIFESQSGLDYLSRRTGGIPIRNTNDLSRGIKRVLDDQSGYYLIGYRPDESTFDARTGRRRFHRLGIKVKRPGLSVRHRSGFYGITDEEARPLRRTREEQLVGALTSPFGSSGVHVRLTSVFANDAKLGSFMRSMLHVDARDLKFTEDAEGWHQATFDVLAVTFGDNGTVVDQVGRTHTLRLRGETYKRVIERGFIYFFTVPVKKAGAYQMRAALRDSSSERTGSASQFIEVPDIKKNRLTLSGIIASSAEPASVKKQPQPDAAGGGTDGGASSSETGATQNTADAEYEKDPQTSAAVRQFRPGSVLQFGYFIYNAQPDKATGRPQLRGQVRLFRDGQQIFAGKEVLITGTETQTDMKRIAAGGALRLGQDLTPGDYVLQVVVTDLLAKEKYRTTTQWIDFEIVK